MYSKDFPVYNNEDSFVKSNKEISMHNSHCVRTDSFFLFFFCNAKETVKELRREALVKRFPAAQLQSVTDEISTVLAIEESRNVE